MGTTNRRHYAATFKRPPAPNACRGVLAALEALYSSEPLPADVAAQIARECAVAPARPARQGDLALIIPERPSE